MEFVGRQARWWVWCSDRGERWADGRPVLGMDAGHAAENWAAAHDREMVEYNIAGGRLSVTLGVKPFGKPNAETEWFVVSGWAEPCYSAARTTAPDEGGNREG